MPRRSSTPILCVVVAALLLLPACSSGDGGEDAAPRGSGTDASGSSTGPSPDARRPTARSRSSSPGSPRTPSRPTAEADAAVGVGTIKALDP